MESWAKTEKVARDISAIRYGVPCKPERLANGINHDCVCKIDANHWVILEVTKNDNLDKIRNDIIRLSLTRTNLFTKENIYCECYLILSFEPSPSMKDAAKESNIRILHISDYINAFFDRSSYYHLRSKGRFGSAVDVISGEPDSRPYVAVAYDDKVRSKSYSVSELSDLLMAGRNVVLTGTFGSGKSRCYKELFQFISNNEDTFCLSIDLRDVGALGSANQIIRAHFEALGLDSMGEAATRLLNAKKLVVLLDGFDEMGGAQWSDDPQKLKEIRRRILKPIREIVTKSQATFISGREHYFNSDEELVSALGITESSDLLLECREEFTSEEIVSFIGESNRLASLPEWLPKRPLLYQVLIELQKNDHPINLDKSEGQAELWSQISTLICQREARINSNFEAGTIFEILKKLGRESRKFSSDVEPVTLESLKAAYKAVRGYEPADEDTVLLQKLPGLGRISYDSRDRRFVDKYLVDGFRASDLCDVLLSQDNSAIEDIWINPLDVLGLSVVAKGITDVAGFDTSIGLAKRASVRSNSILAADIVSALGFSDIDCINFSGQVITGATISFLDLSSAKYENLAFSDCIIHKLQMPNYEVRNLTFTSCLIDLTLGISSHKGIPPWFIGCEFNKFDNIANSASIRNLKLTPPQRILCVILHKTFFQPGKGRQEEALLRGLGQIDKSGATKTILRVLVREKFLLEDKGRHGFLYVPLLDKKPAASRLLNLQSQSGEPIWEEISKLN